MPLPLAPDHTLGARSQSGARPFVPALTFGEIDLVSLKGPVRA